MKHFLTVLLWCSLCLGAQCLLAQPLNVIDPQKCAPAPDQGSSAFKCVTLGHRLQCGGGKNFGPWYVLTSTAPKGLTVKYAEGQVFAGRGKGDADHRCRVTSDKSPISTEGPTKGYKSGTAYWAQCYIAEEDSTHVVVKVNIQGIENSQGGDKIFGTPGSLYGEAALTVIYH